MTEIDRFYEILERLSQSTGGPRLLGDCGRRQDWPSRGVYFFFEDGEGRPETNQPRVVRIGTHGLKLGSKSTLYGRLAQHRGSRSGAGNHRGSVFRRHVGGALIARQSIKCETWGIGSNAPREVRLAEHSIELEVSKYLGRMKVLWLEVADEPQPTSLRGYIERNAIGLLSGKELASPGWLGSYTSNPSIARSHLWNVNHIDEKPDQEFLEVFSSFVERGAT